MRTYTIQILHDNAKEHEGNQLENLVVQPEATYVFNLGIWIWNVWIECIGKATFFATRIKKNTKVHVLELFIQPVEQNILKDKMVCLGSTIYLTSRFRLVTAQNGNRRIFQFITNSIDLSAKEIADMYHARWQIELLFKYIK